MSSCIKIEVMVLKGIFCHSLLGLAFENGLERFVVWFVGGCSIVGKRMKFMESSIDYSLKELKASLPNFFKKIPDKVESYISASLCVNVCVCVFLFI